MDQIDIEKLFDDAFKRFEYYLLVQRDSIGLARKKSGLENLGQQKSTKRNVTLDIRYIRIKDELKKIKKAEAKLGVKKVIVVDYSEEDISKAAPIYKKKINEKNALALQRQSEIEIEKNTPIVQPIDITQRAIMAIMKREF